jgi:peptidoglycan hydrolase-like protein with peptidoglycan-binding domain
MRVLNRQGGRAGQSDILLYALAIQGAKTNTFDKVWARDSRGHLLPSPHLNFGDCRMVRRFFLVFWFAMGLSAPAMAQQSTFVQVEAHPTLSKAQERARAYDGALPDVNGFRLRSGWYALALGPYSENEAQRRLSNLRASGVIPRDSYLSDARPYGRKFWPVGGSAATATPTPEANTQTVIAPEPDPVELDETPREARASERLMTREERVELQRLLQWFGHYNAALDGAYGRGTRASMAAWQEANGFEPTGIMTTKQRVAIADNYADALKAMGLGDVIDTKAGISITMPAELVQFSKYDPPFVQYEPKNDSGIQVLLISQYGDRDTLFGLYEIMQTLEIVPFEGERSKKSDSFVLTGQNPTLHSHTEASLKDSQIHGFTLVYPPSKASDMQRVIKIMQDSIESLGTALDPAVGAGSEQSIDLLSGLQLRRPKLSRSGFYVSGNGQVVTSASAVQSCERLTLDDDFDATIVASNDRFALLAPVTDLVPLGFASLTTANARLRSDVAVSGYSYEGALAGSTLTYGTLEDLKSLEGDLSVKRLSLKSLSGDIGGPVMTPAGAVSGMLLPAETGTRALPDDVQYAVRAAEIAAFLSENGTNPRASESDARIAPEDLVIAASDITVLVSCW